MGTEKSIVDARYAVAESNNRWHFVTKTESGYEVLCSSRDRAEFDVFSTEHVKPDVTLCSECMYQAFGLTKIDIYRGDTTD